MNQLSEKRFEKSKSDITDYRIYDNGKEDAYFIDCDDEDTVDEIVNLLNELYEENEQLRKDKEQLKERLRECGRRLDRFNFR